MKEIKLTRGQVALVDDEDFEYLNQWKWQAMKWHNSDKYYASRTEVKKQVIDGEIWINRKTIKMHRLIMCVSDANILIDHKNGNGLHNYKNNLRTATQRQNVINRCSYGKVSGFKGIVQRGTSGQWSAYITVNRKVLFLGTFMTKEEAAKAYNQAAIINFGEFARLNPVADDIIPVRVSFIKKPNTSSAYKGVTLVKSKKWQASIRKNGKLIHLGTFGTEELASQAYQNSLSFDSKI